MTYRVRPARTADYDQVAAFTADTFEWGDYVADQFLEWLSTPDSETVVAVDDSDRVVGVVRAVLMSEHEIWLHGARVHPDHRRGGIGSLLARAGLDFGRRHDARIARLLIEDWNRSAQGQVEKLGFHRSGEWVAATKDLAMEPSTNGHRRVAGDEQLTPARRTDTDLAWMTWTVSDLALVGRALIGEEWLFRSMRIDDLEQAVIHGRLWQCPAGWVIGGIDEQGVFRVGWLQTTDLDATRLVRAVIDLADRLRAESVWMTVPATEWMIEALRQYEFRLHPFTVWVKTVS